MASAGRVEFDCPAVVADVLGQVYSSNSEFDPGSVNVGGGKGKVDPV